MEHPTRPHGQTDDGQPASGTQAAAALDATALAAHQYASQKVKWGSHARCDCSAYSAFGDQEEVLENDAHRTTICVGCALKDMMGVVVLRGGNRDNTRSGQDVSFALANADVNPDNAAALMAVMYGTAHADELRAFIQDGAQSSTWLGNSTNHLCIEEFLDISVNSDAALHEAMPMVLATLQVLRLMADCFTSGRKSAATRWLKLQPERFALATEQQYRPLQLLFARFPTYFGDLKAQTPLGFAEDADKLLLIEAWSSYCVRCYADTEASATCDVAVDETAFFKAMIAAVPAPYRYILLVAIRQPRMRVIVNDTGTTVVCPSLNEFVMTLAQSNCVWPCSPARLEKWTMFCIDRDFDMHADQFNPEGLDLRGQDFNIGELIGANVRASDWSVYADGDSLSLRQLSRAAARSASAAVAACGASDNAQGDARSAGVSAVAASAISLAGRSRTSRVPLSPSTSNMFSSLVRSCSSSSGEIDEGSSGSTTEVEAPPTTPPRAAAGGQAANGAVGFTDVDVAGRATAASSISSALARARQRARAGGGQRSSDTKNASATRVRRRRRLLQEGKNEGDIGAAAAIAATNANALTKAAQEEIASLKAALRLSRQAASSKTSAGGVGGVHNNAMQQREHANDGAGAVCRFSSCSEPVAFGVCACPRPHGGIMTDGSLLDNAVLVTEAAPPDKQAHCRRLLAAAFLRDDPTALKIVEVMLLDSLFGDTSSDEECTIAAVPVDWGDARQWATTVLANGPQTSFECYPEVMVHLATRSERKAIIELIENIYDDGQSRESVTNTFTLMDQVNRISTRQTRRAFPESAWHHAKPGFTVTNKGKPARRGIDHSPRRSSATRRAETPRGASIDAARERVAASRKAASRRASQKASRAAKIAKKATVTAKREARRRDKAKDSAAARAAAALQADTTDTASETDSDSGSDCTSLPAWAYINNSSNSDDSDGDDDEGKRGASSQPAGQPSPQRRRTVREKSDHEQESKASGSGDEEKSREPNLNELMTKYEMQPDAEYGQHHAAMNNRAMVKSLIESQPMTAGGRDWTGRTTLSDLEKVVAALVEIGARLAGKHEDPSPAMMMQLEHGTWYDVSTNAPRVEIEFTGGAAKMTRKDRDGRRWPHIGCEARFKVIMLLANKSCLHKLMDAQRRAIAATCAYDSKIATGHVQFYQASIAAFKCFTAAMTRQWRRHRRPTYTAGDRLKWNRWICNYVNWILRAYVVDGVFIIDMNTQFFDDCKEVNTPIPTRRCLIDDQMEVENNALAHRCKATKRSATTSQPAATAATRQPRQPRQQTRAQPAQPRQQRAQAAPRAAAAPRNSSAPQARVRDMTNAPPTAHEVLTNVCLRCGQNGHSTTGCPTPKDKTTRTAAQTAANDAINARKKQLEKTRRDWMAAQRRREAAE